MNEESLDGKTLSPKWKELEERPERSYYRFLRDIHSGFLFSYFDALGTIKRQLDEKTINSKRAYFLVTLFDEVVDRCGKTLYLKRLGRSYKEGIDLFNRKRGKIYQEEWVKEICEE